MASSPLLMERNWKISSRNTTATESSRLKTWVRTISRLVVTDISALPAIFTVMPGGKWVSA